MSSTDIREYLRVSFESGSMKVWLEGAHLADDRGWVASMARESWVLGRRWTGSRLMRRRLGRKLASWVEYGMLDSAEAHLFAGHIIVSIQSSKNLRSKGPIVHLLSLDEVDPRMAVIADVMEA